MLSSRQTIQLRSNNNIPTPIRQLMYHVSSLKHVNSLMCCQNLTSIHYSFTNVLGYFTGIFYWVILMFLVQVILMRQCWFQTKLNLFGDKIRKANLKVNMGHQKLHVDVCFMSLISAQLHMYQLTIYSILVPYTHTHYTTFPLTTCIYTNM